MLSNFILNYFKLIAKYCTLNLRIKQWNYLVHLYYFTLNNQTVNLLFTYIYTAKIGRLTPAYKEPVFMSPSIGFGKSGDTSSSYLGIVSNEQFALSDFIIF